MHHNEEIFLENPSFEEIAKKLEIFDNWNFITSNDGKEISLWKLKPFFTWSGWKNNHETPIELKLANISIGNLHNASNMIYCKNK